MTFARVGSGVVGFSVAVGWSRALTVLTFSDLGGCPFLGPVARESRLLFGLFWYVPVGILGLPASPAASL